MYKDNIQMTGRPPTMANSEFLTNKEQGDWAEQVVYKAINEYSDEFFAVEYGRSESIAAGEEGFADFYKEYQMKRFDYFPISWAERLAHRTCPIGALEPLPEK